MRTLKSIDPIQLGKVYAVIYFIIMLVVFVPFILIFSVIGAGAGSDHGLSGLAFGLGGGIFMAILVPFFYGIIAFIIGVLSAWIYNVTYKYHGGIKVTVE